MAWPCAKLKTATPSGVELEVEMDVIKFRIAAKAGRAGIIEYQHEFRIARACALLQENRLQPNAVARTIWREVAARLARSPHAALTPDPSPKLGRGVTYRIRD